MKSIIYLLLMCWLVSFSLHANDDEAVIEVGNKVYFNVPGEVEFESTFEVDDKGFVELPEIGAEFAQDDDMAVVESVKAASDVYAPISGEIVEINDALVDEPAKVNEDPSGAAWFVKIKPSDLSQLDNLLDDAAYKELLG